MWTTIGSIVTTPILVTTVTLMVDIVHVVWENLPTITLTLRAAGAALSIAAGIRALRHRRCNQHNRNIPDSETNQ